jgi:hypothetical protein
VSASSDYRNRSLAAPESTSQTRCSTSTAQRSVAGPLESFDSYFAFVLARIPEL